MEYPISSRENGRDDTLLNLLSANELSVQSFTMTHGKNHPFELRQSFMTAGKLFKSIDAPTHSVIVQYGEAGTSLVSQICAAFKIEREYKLLHEAQQYSVNIFSQEFEELKEVGALFPVQEGTEIYYLDKKFYNEQFGISMKAVNKEEILNV